MGKTIGLSDLVNINSALGDVILVEYLSFFIFFILCFYSNEQVKQVCKFFSTIFT